MTRPSFQRRVTDIVTEWASSGQQTARPVFVAAGIPPGRSFRPSLSRYGCAHTLDDTASDPANDRDVEGSEPEIGAYETNDARRFPAAQPWPASLRTSFEEQPSQPLANYIDGLLYLGPDRDRDLTGSIPVSEPQKRELDRRGSLLQPDPQYVMRARYQGRGQWFRARPDDIAAWPQ